jgi:opacity protein-like surface antigen
MKIHTIRGLAAAAFLLVASAAHAQWDTYRPDRSLWLIGWGLGQTLGSLSDYQNGTSVAGFSMEFRSIVKPRVSAGLAFDYNRFDRTNSLETVARPGGGTLSAPTYRYADDFGIKATGHYYLADGNLRPYAGLGIGGNWSYAYAQTADLASTDSDFSFLLTPEVGLLFDLAAGKSSVSLNVAFRYNYSTADFGSVKDQQWLSEVIGISVSY